MLRARTYEKFGSFLLFRKLHADALSELWRGARLPGGEPTAVRRFIGGDLDALRAAAESAGRIVPHLTGTTIVRKQQIGVSDASPFIAFHYSGGRPLGHIVESAQRSKVPNPVPIDQALTIAEKVAQSLVTLHHLKLQGRRLSHGALLPDFIWVSEDGEIRVAGQQMTEGFVRSRSVSDVSTLIDPYLAPELIEGEEAGPRSDMYSLGAILFLLLTGRQPPRPSSSTSVVTALDEARLQTSGEAIPPELRSLLDRTIAWEPGGRFLSPAEAHRCVSTLLQADQYTATTFNLAFYLTTLLKEDLQR
ncbi:MAG: protein kinase, partial [Acidobacteriota bacterium]